MTLQPLRSVLCSMIAAIGLPLALMSTVARAQSIPLPGMTMPPADRAWKVEDFSSAATAIRMRQNFLPRASEADFGPRFAKLTAAATLQEMHAASDPIELRMNNGFAVMQAIRTAFATYAEAGPAYLPETVRLLAMLLDTSAFVMPLAGEFLAAVPRDDKYAARVNGMEQVRRGVGNMALGAAITIGEQQAAEHQVLLAQALARTLPVLKKTMAPDAIEAVRKQLAGPMTLHSDQAREAVKLAQQAAA